ncbi:transmembrane anchor protein [uncultured Brevundimonas sp.]|uniref:transmembrane anchor protein n=1 Tax=uncultured Brevundimonas sp. TaxID=213418 RepID=UPI0030EBFD13
MQNANKPDPADLPSTGKLLKSTAVAVAIAAGLLVTIVLPAEYGTDPTRVGSLLGLTEMGRIKMQLAAEARAGDAGVLTEAAAPPPALPTLPATVPPTTPTPEPAAPPVPKPAATTPAAVTVAPVRAAVPTVAGRTDQTVLTLAPDEGAEIKLTMQDGATASFVWFTDGERVNFDTHGDGAGISYHGYGKGTDSRVEGQLMAAFTGKHGWFWRNRSGQTVRITLQTRGAYTAVETFD